MIPNADELDDNNPKPTETADDIARRAVDDFYATWKAEGSTGHCVHDEDVLPHRTPRSYLYSQDVIVEPTDITNVLRRALPVTLIPPSILGTDGRSPHSTDNESRFAEELEARQQEVRTLAEELLGSPGAAQRWFATSFRYELKGRPTDFMRSLSGCDEVERFLLSLYPPHTA